MSPIRCCGLLCAWALLASAPARADDPAAPPAATPSPHAGAHAGLNGLPDCPHCRKAGLVAGATTAGESAVPSIDLPGLAARPAPPAATAEPDPVDTRAMLDVDVRQIQLPAGPARPRPRLPSPTLPVPTARPRMPRAPSTSSSNVPGSIMAPGDPEPPTPASAPEPRSGPTATLAPPAGAAELPPAMEPPPLAAEPVPPLAPPAGMATPAPANDGPPDPSSSRDESRPVITYLPPAPRADDPEASARLAQAPNPAVEPTIPALPSAPAAAAAAAAAAGPSASLIGPAAAPEYAPPDLAVPMVDGHHAHPGTNGFTYLPVMLGDQSPASMLMGMPLQSRAIVPGQPPTPPSPFAAAVQSRTTAALIPWARGFKIADNQSPMPQDRVFYSFNYYNNMNESINRRLGSSVSALQAYRQILGIEKTFWRGNASIGVRLPIETLSSSSRDPLLGGTSTAVGNVSVFSKFLLYDNPLSGSLLSGGLAITAPTGPSSFGGSPASPGFRDVQIQPFLGYVLRRGGLFLQGFSAIDIPTNSRDVTMWYNDVAVGYFLYRDDDPHALLSAIVPTFEAHLNDPLSHRGAPRFNDPAGTPDVLDLTFGSSFILRRRLVATLGCSFPVTGPQPFDVEALALLNFYYGRSGMGTPWPMPPAGR